MKTVLFKTFVVILSAVLCLCILSACGNNDADDDKPEQTEKKTEKQTETQTNEPEEKSECELNGHTWAEATCTAAKTCSVCGETEGEALEHTWADATCTEPKTCSICGVTEGEALEHTWTEATCTEPKKCSACGETEGEALGHTWVDATCTEPKKCTVCETAEGEALGHTWTEATCTEAAVCSVCGTDGEQALGHDWVEATCTVPKTCSRCEITEGDVVDHNYENRLCTMCGQRQPSEGLKFQLDGDTYIVSGIGSCRDTDIVIPSTYDGKAVTGIRNSTFSSCKSITSVIIPYGVTYIGHQAFSYCTNLESVTIPDSVTSIEASAFFHCEKLTSVTIPEGVTRINTETFRECWKLENIVIPDSVTSIGRCAVYGCSSLTSINIPDSVTMIEESAFAQCLNLKYNVYGNAKYLGNENNPYVALMGVTKSDITSCEIHADMKVIAVNAIYFYYGSNLEYNIYDNAKYLGNDNNPYMVLIEATDTDITSCEIHEDTMFIYQSAFSECSSLMSINIPNSVISIGVNAFFGCESLEAVYITDISAWCGIKFHTITNGSINVNPLRYAHNLYLNGDILTELTIPDEITSIGDCAFDGCSRLTSITIHDGVTSIGGFALDDCTSLTDINYAGTMEQWADIEKASGWNYNTGEYTVHCSDGDLTKAES